MLATQPARGFPCHKEAAEGETSKINIFIMDSKIRIYGTPESQQQRVCRDVVAPERGENWR